MATHTRRKTRGGAWRSEVAVRRTELEDRLRIAEAENKAAAAPKAYDARFGAVRAALDDAGDAIAERRSVGAWWTGSAITTGWQSVHMAEGGLACVEQDPNVVARIPRLRSWMWDVMTPTQRAQYERRLAAVQSAATIDERDRAFVRQAYTDVIMANGEKHASLRKFRNLLLFVSAGLFLGLVGLGVWHAIQPDALSLCADVDTTGRRTCFPGPTRSSVFEVEAIGALGGLFGVAVLLTKLKRAPSRYNVLAALAILKPIAGAAAALIGILLILSGLIVEPAKGNGPATLIAYAAIFGLSQQLLTRFIDQHAESLLGAADDQDAPRPDPAGAGTVDDLGAISKLDELHRQGAVTDDEFAAAKGILLARL